MGAEWFVTEGYGETAHEAFKDAVDTAIIESGTNGYSGTIKEVDSFQMIEIPEGKCADDFDEDERIDDKWGDCGCYKVRDGVYGFFGWASS